MNDLKESNQEAQFADDAKNATDEEIGGATINKFTQVMQLNQQVFENAKQTRAFFEQELKDAKAYIAWNEARQEEIQRKSDSLLDNQCYSNQLFVRSLRFNDEALEAIRFLKQDVNGYIINGADNFDLAQIAKNPEGAESNGVETVAERLKKFSAIFNQNEVQSFLALAEREDSSSSDSDDEEPQRAPKRKGTLPEQIYAVLEDLEARVQDAIENLEQNEIAAAW